MKTSRREIIVVELNGSRPTKTFVKLITIFFLINLKPIGFETKHQSLVLGKFSRMRTAIYSKMLWSKPVAPNHCFEAEIVETTFVFSCFSDI